MTFHSSVVSPHALTLSPHSLSSHSLHSLLRPLQISTNQALPLHPALSPGPQLTSCHPYIHILLHAPPLILVCVSPHGTFILCSRRAVSPSSQPPVWLPSSWCPCSPPSTHPPYSALPHICLLWRNHLPPSHPDSITSAPQE